MMKTVLIAGGGTGGHIFPALAIGYALQDRRPQCRVVFAGTRYGMEQQLIPKHGFPLILLPMRGLLGKRLSQKLALLWRLPASLLASLWYLMKWRPKVLVGVGGYASLPMVLVGALLRIPIMIQEQNAIPGLVNRLASRFAKVACLGFAQAAPHLRCPCVVTGNPVRRAFFDLPPWDLERKTIAILGGSQGARLLNETVPKLLCQTLRPRDGCNVLHQAGPAFVDQVRQSYADAPFPVTVTAFVEDVPELLARTRLVICRAGASTLSELLAAKVPAILVPFAKATHDHQTHNARSLVQSGCAVMIPECDLPNSASRFSAVINDPETLTRMASRFDSSVTDGAIRCAEIIEILATHKGKIQLQGDAP